MARSAERLFEIPVIDAKIRAWRIAGERFLRLMRIDSCQQAAEVPHRSTLRGHQPLTSVLCVRHDPERLAVHWRPAVEYIDSVHDPSADQQRNECDSDGAGATLLTEPVPDQ